MNTAFAESQNEPVESTSTQMSNGETQAELPAERRPMHADFYR